jgi:hypothetical protein
MSEGMGPQSSYDLDALHGIRILDGIVGTENDVDIPSIPAIIQNEFSRHKKQSKEPPYIIIYTKNTVEQFIKRYMLGTAKIQALVLVSPFISTLMGEVYELKDVLKKAKRDQTRVYVVTRKPEAEYQFKGIDLLNQFSCVEIRYNPDIHAKLYISWGRELEESFAFFGSGNLTSGGLRYNLELGMMILARGDGKNIIRKLYSWGSHDIRVASKIIKMIH